MDWEFYFCRVEGEIATNVVDLEVVAPQAERPMIVYLRVVRAEQGCDLSAAEEADLFDAIEAHLETLATRYNAVYVGRSTTESARCFVCYAPEFTILRHRIERAFATLASYGYAYHTGSGRDADWNVYRDFLFPDRETLRTLPRPRRKA